MSLWSPENGEADGWPPSPDRKTFGHPHDLGKELSRHSDRIVSLILFSDLPWIDIVLEIQRMRERVEEEAPEMLDVFERIYVARFERIRDQWREE